jgi:AraC-like DNA-binding protein
MGIRLVEMLAGFAKSEGYNQSYLDGVQFMRVSRAMPRHPVVYEPGIFIIAQGRKRGYLGGRVYTYDAKNYLVLSVPLPFECEVEANPKVPLLGLSVRVDPVTVAELLMEMDEFPAKRVAMPRGIYATPLHGDLCDAAQRLLECLRTPAEARILGPQIVREMTYRVQRGPQGDALRAVAARHSHFGQISKALQRMHTGYSDSLDVETLARESGMSVSTFHHNFKAVTSSSPLQYLKAIRLHQARLLMVNDGLGAGVAAGRVGYESPSQFSREFKRFFGKTPADEAERIRTTLG